MDNQNNNEIKHKGLQSRIAAEVDPSLKEAYEKWWKSKGFASEADAIRWHIRNVTNWTPESQAKTT